MATPRTPEACEQCGAEFNDISHTAFACVMRQNDNLRAENTALKAKLEAAEKALRRASTTIHLLQCDEETDFDSAECYAIYVALTVLEKP